jgi:hypothetical protein
MGMILMTPHAPLQRVCIALSSQPKKHSSAMDTAPLIVALLMDKPRTARDLSNDSGIHISTVKRWLMAFHGAGVLTWEKHPSQNRIGRHGPIRLWRMHLPEAVS